MYNGQYIKAIVHVLVFVILMGMADRYWFFWLLLAFWVLVSGFRRAPDGASAEVWDAAAGSFWTE